MDIPESLTNHFLIAMPGMEDPNFAHTVTYVCEHNSEGALGIVINRPLTDVSLGDVLSQLEIESDDVAVIRQPVFLGGPVQPEHGFVLHESTAEWQGNLQISDEIGLTTSRDILRAIADGRGPSNNLVALGYAGWGSGQLEQELLQNTWLSAPATPYVLFQMASEQRWHGAATLLGIDLNLLSGASGHA